MIQTLLYQLRRHREEIVPMCMIMVLAISVFVFFKAFFDSNPDNFAVEILAAVLGSIVTVMITMLLIKRQGTVEQAQEAATTSKTKVFEKKLQLFNEFISIYVRCAADGELDKGELLSLEELALTISMFTNDAPLDNQLQDLGEELCRYVLQLELFGLATKLEDSQHELYDRFLRAPGAGNPKRELISFVHILHLMKIELGVGQFEQDGFEPDMFIVKRHEWTRRLLEYRDHQK